MRISFKGAQIYQRGSTMQRRLVLTGTGLYVGGTLFFWIPDLLFCHQLGLEPLKFHAWFHVTSALGSYVFVVMIAYTHYLDVKRNPSIVYKGPILPCVRLGASKD
mmetsp:Transcript_28654/g.67744  ORF Transcript_28654/g.67744 Transcript_28654/m.67744 type:complete len:105 (-) Transcript_28654:28-342(-)